MTQIQITNLRRYDSYIEVSYQMRLTLPTSLGSTNSPKPGIDAICNSLTDGFTLEVQKGVSPNPDSYYINYNKTESLPTTVTLSQIQSKLVTKYGQLRAKLDSLAFTPYEQAAMLTWDGTSWS